MGSSEMKIVFYIAAAASLAQSPAQAWANNVTAPASWAIGNDFRSMQQLAPSHLLPIEFPAPISVNSASIVLDLDQALIMIDPVGNQDQYISFGRPDIVILTRAHPNHLSINTMIGLLRRGTVVLAPQSVIDQLPLMISNNVITPFEAGSTQTVDGITFNALSAASGISKGTQIYQRDRGDIGVVIEVNGSRAYF
jgi:hypothetical protein